MKLIILPAVWMLTLLIGILAGRFWAIVRAKGTRIWPWSYVPLWLTPHRLYLLTAFEILGLVASFALTFLLLGIIFALVAAVLFLPLKHILVAVWMRDWFRIHGRDGSARDVLDMVDEESPR